MSEFVLRESWHRPANSSRDEWTGVILCPECNLQTDLRCQPPPSDEVKRILWASGVDTLTRAHDALGCVPQSPRELTADERLRARLPPKVT